jgi:hypothetical protein
MSCPPSFSIDYVILYQKFHSLSSGMLVCYKQEGKRRKSSQVLPPQWRFPSGKAQGSPLGISGVFRAASPFSCQNSSTTVKMSSVVVRFSGQMQSSTQLRFTVDSLEKPL